MQAAPMNSSQGEHLAANANESISEQKNLFELATLPDNTERSSCASI